MPGRQRAAQAELLFHAAGELARGPVHEGRQASGLDQGGDAPFALGRPLAEQATEEVDVLGHRQREVQVLAQPLGHVGNARTDRGSMGRVGDVASEHGDPALLHRAVAGDQREQARFADTVRADEPDHAAGRNIEIDPIEGDRLAIAQSDLAQAHDRLDLSDHGCPSVAVQSRTCSCGGHSAFGSSCT